MLLLLSLFDMINKFFTWFNMCWVFFQLEKNEKSIV